MVDKVEIEKEIEKLTQFINDNIVNPNIPNAYYNRGLAYYNLGENKKAIEDFSYFIENSRDNTDGYLSRGAAYHMLEEYQKAIEDYDKAIEKNKTESKAYYNRGLSLNKLDLFEEAITNFDKAIEHGFEESTIYRDRGLSYLSLGKYDEAINDYNKSIIDDNNDCTAHYNRGLAYLECNKLEEAIEDFSYIIDNKDKTYEYLSRGYNCRGTAYHRQEKYQKAIKDYKQSIDINNRDSRTYYNRGLSYLECNKLEKAIADFKTCTELDPNFLEAHLVLGNIYYIQQNYEESATSFYSAKKDPLFILSQLYIIDRKKSTDKMRTVISKMIDLDEINFFKRTTPSLNDTDKNKCKAIYIKALELISLLYISNKDELTFSHYTKRSTASQLIFESSPFRLNSTITCNDPEEGETILKYLAIDLEKSKTEKGHRYQAFIGCFTFNRESLNQFRLYGKEDNKEATGVSIVIKKEFFDEEIGVPLLTQICQPDTSQLFESDNYLVRNTEKEDTKKKDKEVNKKYALYRCIYLDPETKRVISVGHKEEYAFYRENSSCSPETIKEYKKEIDKVIEDVNAKLNELCELIEGAKGKNENLPIICELLLPLRYLVKHVAFKEEQECRIFDVKDLIEDKEKDKNDKEIQFTPDFMQMYIESQPIKKEELAGIIFAPKAEKIEVFNEALIQNDFEIQGNRSTLPFA